VPDALTANVTFRPARARDVPRMAELIAAAHLPPLFIEEYIDGFITAQQGAELIACGGIEIYDDCGVIRSVVVDEAVRGFGLGGKLAELLMAKGREAEVTDLFLFTADALPFWQHYGFVEVTFDDWKDPPRASWQYQFISQNHDLIPDVHAMWRRA
jgi:amino-acid N-acetyltransferase